MEEFVTFFSAEATVDTEKWGKYDAVYHQHFSMQWIAA